MPFREMNREQAWLLPPTLDELVPPDHLARLYGVQIGALTLLSAHNFYTPHILIRPI